MNTICTKSCIISSFLVLITSFLTICHATDIINTSNTLRDNETATLISSGGSLELGFFSPDNSVNRYVGMWYKKITPRIVVWVANRDNPINDRTGTLTVIGSGRLVLLNGTGGVVWSTNASRAAQNPVAQLLDSGNLVVKDAGDDNPENFLWQSFDYPTDTLLPGMKFGWNLRTGHEVYFTSWKNSSDPATGDYTFRLEANEYPQPVTRKGENVVTRSGPWNGASFGWDPNFGKNSIFTFQVVIDENEVYYLDKQLDQSAYTRIKLTETGSAQRWVWDNRTEGWNMYVSFPIDTCDTFGLCGPYGSCSIENSPPCGCLNKFTPRDTPGWDRGNWTNGCVRSTPLDCQNGDAFLKYTSIKLPYTEHSWYNKSMTLEECKVLCTSNCSCMAYTGLNILDGGETGCLLWFDELVDIRETSAGQDIYIRVASSELESGGRKKEILIITLSLSVGVVLLSMSLFLYLRRRKKLLRQLQETGLPVINYVENHDLELPLFHLSTITKATSNFSFGNKLGEGGFGPVYKGQLDDGREIAVKCQSRTSHQGVDEFKNEVLCIAKLQHRNLVKLLGWCSQGPEMMLVYEYMPNKSLDLILFDQVKSTSLDWPRRFNIINGIARGLLYLHQDSRLRVIHRDLKASNVLLDSDMNPKISDFGLARSVGGNETGANTSRVVGTHGYISPEYATYGLFSVKSDVFSFGVLVLEIVTGKRNRGFSYRDEHLNLLGFAWMLYSEGRSLEMADSSLQNTCDLAEVLRSINIGLLCVQESPKDRPTMSSVVQMLGSDSVLPEARHPGFFTGLEVLKTETPILLETQSSTMSCTLLEGR